MVDQNSHSFRVLLQLQHSLYYPQALTQILFTTQNNILQLAVSLEIKNFIKFKYKLFREEGIEDNAQFILSEI